MSRNRTVCMMRVRNEARWIRECVSRAFAVCQTVVLLDDGSEDDTRTEVMSALGEEWHGYSSDLGAVTVASGRRGEQLCVIHYLASPFISMARPPIRVNEIRDKNLLWEYVKLLDFDYCLCLDGDEWLSKKAIREWPSALAVLENGYDIVHFPFVYVWDQEGQQRVDGIYGPVAPEHKTLNFPRLFSIKRVTENNLFEMRFSWYGTKGGFHCGSIPREKFLIDGHEPAAQRVNLPILHWGYFDERLRQQKFEFYNRVDPNNDFEGRYLHVIAQPNRHAPGPVQFAEWRDE